MLKPILVHRSKLDVSRWDEHVSQSCQTVIYAHSFYLDAVCNEWAALVWPSAADYQIVMPIPLRRKLGLPRICQPLFCQYLGIFSRDELREDEAESFLEALGAHFSYVADYCFNPENTRVLTALLYRFPNFKATISTTDWLDLSQDYADLQERYSGDRKVNVQRAISHEWNAISFNNIHPVIKLFIQNHAECIPGGVSHMAYNTLEKLFTELCKHGVAEMRYAHKRGTIHAGVLLVKNAGRVIYLFNAADDIGRKGNARTFLLDQYFRQHCGEELHFDFECPDVEPVLRFYKSFGGTSVPFFRISKNGLPFPLKQIQEFRKAWKSKPFKLFAKTFV